MDSSIPFLFTLALIILIVGPILAIAAFVRSNKANEETARIPQILGRLYALEQKLEALEKIIEERTGAPQAEPSAPAVPPAAPPRPERARTIPAAPAASLPAPVSSTRVSPRPAVNVEAMIAGHWLNYVGILALLLAVAFFLKYAFENNWVGPRGRVGIGLLIGSGLFPWSQHLLNRGYRFFSEGIAGLGAAVLYLSLWAGWHYYQLFPQGVAFGLMIVVTAVTAAVAVGRNSERIAVLAVLGGILTPQLVSTGKDQEIILFSYLAVLAAAMLVLARMRDWKTLPPIQFVATVVYFWAWYATFYREAALDRTVFFATLFFLLFAALPVVRSWREGRLSGFEVSLVLINAFVYLAALRVLLWPDHRWALTIAVLALSAAHLAVQRALPERSGTQSGTVRILFSGLALTFLTLAVPIRLDGKWITMAWAIEGAVLIWSGLRIQLPLLRGAGFLLFAVTAFRLAFFPIPAERFLLNARFAAFAVTVACFALACDFARKSAAKRGEAENFALAVTAIAANVGALTALSLEIWDAFGRMPGLGIDRGLAQQLALSTLWLVYALGLMAAGFWKKSAPLRWQALALLGVVIAKVFLFDLSFLERFYRILSFFLLGLALTLISFYYQRRLTATSSGKDS